MCNVGVCHLALDELGPAAELIFLARRLDPTDPIIERAVRALEVRGVVEAPPTPR